MSDLLTLDSTSACLYFAQDIWRNSFQAIDQSESPVPDMLCLCGRIYKDMFIESHYADKSFLENAVTW